MASKHKDATKHITNGISHPLVESSELSDEMATAPRASDGSGLQLDKIKIIFDILKKVSKSRF